MGLPAGASLVNSQPSLPPGASLLPPGASLVGNSPSAPLSEEDAKANPNAAAIQANRATASKMPNPEPDATAVSAGEGAMGTTITGSPEKVQGVRDEVAEGGKRNIKMGLAGMGAEAAAGLVPEVGSGLIGYIGRLLARSGAAGVGAAAGNSAGQAVTGDNPLKKENLEESALTGGATALISVPFEAVAGLSTTKVGRSAINQSVGAQTRDVAYGNPARAITDEGIGDITTGDLEQYKDAIRAGKSPADAANAAGGRFKAVQQRIEEYAPRLDKMLSTSTARIPVSQAIDAPLHDAAVDIINNPAMTDPEKDAAITKLGDLQKSLKDGLGTDISPLEANKIKQALGNRVNWGGTTAVTDEVKPAYKALYSKINQLVAGAVPEAKVLNEHLSNLLAAASDIKTLMAAEEVGRGGGIISGKIGTSLAGMVERGAGRVLPAASQVTKNVEGVAGAVSSLGAQMIHFTASDGTEHSIPPSQIHEAQKIDPTLKVHD